MEALLACRANDMTAIVKSLSVDQVDILMKYIYRGMASPDLFNSGILLQWHEKVSFILTSFNYNSMIGPGSGRCWQHCAGVDGSTGRLTLKINCFPKDRHLLLPLQPHLPYSVSAHMLVEIALFVPIQMHQIVQGDFADTISTIAMQNSN